MGTKELIVADDIQGRIYTLRNSQVMLDHDLAELYGVAIKRLNEQVKRNIVRFPSEFCFQLDEEDITSLKARALSLEATKSLRSQIATLENKRGKHRKYLPYAFTEQGVAMLSAVLRSETAVKVSVQIMNAFVVMRRFLISNAQIFQRLNTLEVKQAHTDKKVDKVLSALESKSIQPKQGIFYNGRIFDAWQFVSGLVRSAKKSIILIDNYIDERILTLFSKRGKDVSALIYTKTISRQLALDIQKFNEQYSPVIVNEFGASHDRFLILDDNDLYHIGASLKDLGKKWFAFSKMDIKAFEVLENLKK